MLTTAHALNGPLGLAEAQIVLGGVGSDFLDGGAGGQIMSGGPGDDFYYVDSDDDVVDESGGSGIDTVEAIVSFSLADSSRVLGDVEHLFLKGDSPIDGVGNELDNLIGGNSARNILSGEAGDDTLVGGVSKDHLWGGTGNDRLIGGKGRDVLFGEEGNDILSGGRGNDKLRGGPGDDRLIGAGNADLLRGGSGDDMLIGGHGPDTLKGGAGADSFVFEHWKQSTEAKPDIIKDFDRSEGDKIDVAKVNEEMWSFIGENEFDGQTGQLRFEAKTMNTFVYGDVDGDGKADFSIKLKGAIDLVKDDFVL